MSEPKCDLFSCRTDLSDVSAAGLTFLMSQLPDLPFRCLSRRTDSSHVSVVELILQTVKIHIGPVGDIYVILLKEIIVVLS